MQSEIIYLLNTKICFLEDCGSCFKLFLPENRQQYVKRIEPLREPFNIITKNRLNNISSHDNPFKYTKEFKELTNPLSSPLEYYLRKAKIDFIMARREDGIVQYLGLTAGEPTIIEEKGIFPCQFYLIKDDLRFIS